MRDRQHQTHARLGALDRFLNKPQNRHRHPKNDQRVPTDGADMPL
jgi:hypothetical protein